MSSPEKSSASSDSRDELERLKEEGLTMTASELARRQQERAKLRPIHSPLDAFGGLKRGSLVEVSGPRSSGRFAIAVSALASATKAGESAALIDLGDHLDPGHAQAAGVVLERLLWVRPEKTGDALVAAEGALWAGFALVVLDMGERKREKPAYSAMLRLARAAEKTEAVLLLISARPLAGPAAKTAVVLEDVRPHWDGLFMGFSARMRARGGPSVPLLCPASPASTSPPSP